MSKIMDTIYAIVARAKPPAPRYPDAPRNPYLNCLGYWSDPVKGSAWERARVLERIAARDAITAASMRSAAE